MDILNTIIGPITTEKTTEMQKDRKYSFRVGRKSDKRSIKKIFELMYGAEVENVRIIIQPSKTRMLKGKYQLTKRPVLKKAIITLKKGEKPIDLNKLKLVKGTK